METKVCPFCGETIMAKAKKCRYCGEWLEAKMPSPANPAPAATAPVNPTPAAAAPVNPAPVAAAPVNPAPAATAPVNPAPVAAAPVNPAPAASAPVNPAPVAAAPVNPAPVEQAPAIPDYTEPAYTDPEYESDVYEENEPAGFFERFYMQSFLRQYANFKGYSSRKEFWMTYLANCIVSLGVSGLGFLIMGLGGFMGIIGAVILFSIYSLALFVPGLAIICRRLRDAGKSPWLILLSMIPFVGSIILIVLLCMPSNYEHEDDECKFGVPDIIITALCVVVLGVGSWMSVKGTANAFGGFAEPDRQVDLYDFETEDDSADWVEAEYEVPYIEGNDDYSWASEYPVSDHDLADMTPAELRLARNSIYARHGYIFKSEDLTEYFSQFDWYRPRYKDVTDLLTDLEIDNIDKIKQYE